MIKTIANILFLGFFIACTPPNKNIERIDLAKLISLSADPNTLIIDVRTPEEVAEGYVKGTTKFINYNDAHFERALDALDKTKSYIVYCRSGNRSSKALDIMDAKGFTNLYELEGGVMAVPAENLVK